MLILVNKNRVFPSEKRIGRKYAILAGRIYNLTKCQVEGVWWANITSGTDYINSVQLSICQLPLASIELVDACSYQYTVFHYVVVKRCLLFGLFPSFFGHNQWAYDNSRFEFKVVYGVGNCIFFLWRNLVAINQYQQVDIAVAFCFSTRL